MEKVENIVNWMLLFMELFTLGCEGKTARSQQRIVAIAV